MSIKASQKDQTQQLQIITDKIYKRLNDVMYHVMSRCDAIIELNDI
jgi:hypothetical protein